MRKRNKWLKAMSIALSCAMLATNVPMNVLATEVSTIAEVQNVTVPVSLDLESGILSYGKYGTWKENVPLSIEVNGIRTELKKDGSSVNVDFKNGDTVKLIVSDDIELYSGTVQVVDSVVSVVAEDDHFGSVEYDIIYDSVLNNLVISGKYFSVGGDGFSDVRYHFDKYTLTAVTSEGTPIQGITLTDNTVNANEFSYELGENEIKWGNGNSLSYENVYDEEEGYTYATNGILTKATDENGYTDSTAPHKLYGDVNVGMSFEIRTSTAGNICASTNVYANNGLVDIDTGYIPSYGGSLCATLESLGNVSSTAIPFVDENGILGEYYKIRSIEVENNGTESVILKDEAGNKIATVEINNFKVKGNVNDIYYLNGQNDDLEDCVFTYDKNIQMAEGMDDWKVTVDFSDNTFNINAVKTVSTDDDNTQDDTNKPEDDSNNSDTSYEVTLPADKTIISTSDFAAVLEENKTKDVVIKSNNNITFTFAKGTMANVDGIENYDFGTKVVSDFANAGNMGSSVTKDNFVTRINYNYSGKLPATATIKIYVGTDYANQTLYYSKIVEDGFKLIQSVKVDKDGYITVSQDSCSDYVVTINELTTTTPDDTQKPEDNKNDDTITSSPDTSDQNNIVTYMTMLICGVGALFVAMQKKRLNK